MSRHGSGGLSIAQVSRAGPLHLESSATDADAPVRIEGFRHFLCDEDTLPLDKQFKVDGKDPFEDFPRLCELMKRLWARMYHLPEWKKAKDSARPNDNPDIPAGYTYLLQLIAHDLVQTNFAPSILGNAAFGVRNERAYRLTLDTIYGGGPEVCPIAYPYHPASGTRSRLSLSGGEATEDFPAMNPKSRDIGRSSGNFNPGGKNRGLTEVLIADPRNDDHAILAQLTALFHHLHNGLISTLEECFPDDKTDYSHTKAAYARFLCARGAAALIYRNIIRHDVMRKILHPDIYKRYNIDEPPFMDRSSVQPHRSSLIPLEFTHGAFRFGHAMARGEYQFNKKNNHPFDVALKTNSLKRPKRMPLDHTWIVDWSFFFSLPNCKNNHQPSRRISPHYAGPLDDGELFPAIDTLNVTGVVYRDLMSASHARLWSVNSLIDEIRNRCPDIIKTSRLLDDRWYRIERLREWLQQHPGDFTEDDLDTLAKEPPLPFFVLFEAATEPDDPLKQGTRLGVLGSVIVAEVIFGALVGDQLPVAKGGFRQSLSRLSQNLLKEDCLDDVPEIETMGQLVEYTATIAELTDACPPFLQTQAC